MTRTLPGPLPTVSIVGRPNVGKSTLFNRLTQTRRAIVDSVPGITRDRMEQPVEWTGRWFRLVDTGGIDFEDPDTIPRQIVEQAIVAMDNSHLVILLADARAGLNPVEREIADLLRRRDVPVIVAANKVDEARSDASALEFHRLGLGDVVPISAEQGHGIDHLLDAILGLLPDAPTERVEDDVVRVAVVGRPNVGKSSLVNRLLGQERLIVSDVPGTTRDAVDVRVRLGELEAILVDTAGLRRKGTDRERIDHVARVMAERAVERADVALLLVDASEGITHQDAVIAGMVVEAGAGLVVLLNKWDLVERQEERFPEIIAELRDSLRFATWAEALTVSVLTGERLHRIGREVARVQENRSRRIPTGRLNDVIDDAMRRHQPPQRGQGREFRVKYLTQVAVKPPAFVAFTTGGRPHFTWQRYLENRLREEFDFTGTPLVIRWRSGRKPRGGSESS
jgi:GTP-binding protein